ncbi:MAG: hypothetical protein KAX31_02415, partial [Thermoplasmata archaeon]|nr:hypothetical protein [Thermoplasmata archaeon]
SWTGEVDILPLANSLGGFASPTATLPYSANTYEDGNYQMCFLEFEFAFITAPADQNDCAWRILNWFMPPEGVTIQPTPQNWYGTPTSYVWYNLTVKNTGFGGADIFDMTYVSPLGWTYDFFEPDMVTPLADTGGVPGVPDTGSIPTWGTKDIAVRVTIPGTAIGGDTDLGTITATSFNNPAVFDDAEVETICYVPGQNYKAVYISYVPEADTAPVATAFLDDFEDGDFSDWTLVGGQNDWQIGTPGGLGGDPGGAANGAFSIGNDLTGLGASIGQYELMVPALGNSIYTPAIDCTGFTGVTLSFERWLGIENAVFDHASIEVSNDGAVWNMVWDHTGGTFTDPAWSTYTYDISAVADLQPTVYIRFNMGPTDWSENYCGWNLDDVHVYQQLPPSAETDQLLYNTAMWTGDTGGNVRLGIVDSWGTDNPTAWLAWAAGHLDVDVVFIDKDPFTFGDLIASRADALVISHASSREYSAAEIAAIEQYCFAGHGLIGTGGSMDFGVPNNVNLGPLFGLAIGSQPWSTPYTEYIMDDPLHPVMAGLPDPFSPGTMFESCTMMTLDGAVQLAHIDTAPTGLITAYVKDTIAP